MIPRGTTPTFTLTFPEGTDLTQASSVYVSFQNGDTRFDKTGSDVTVTERTVELSLTQAETLALNSGSVMIQVNWVYPNGTRAASEIVSCLIGDNLLGEEIE